MAWRGLMLGCLMACAACDNLRDHLTGTVIVHTNSGGQPVGCLMQIFNAEGRQTSEEGINDGYIKLEQLPEGKYTLRFKGHAGQQYPAMVNFQLFEGGELDLVVDLDQAPQPAGGTVVGTRGGHSGS